MSNPTPERPEYADMPEIATVVVRRRGWPINKLTELMDLGFTTLGQAIEAGKFVPAGPPFARYDTNMDENVDFTSDYPLDLEIGFPLAEPLAGSIDAGDEELLPSTLPAGPMARAVHTGPYDDLPTAWETFTKSVLADGYAMSLPFWEAYHTMPSPEADPQTMETGLAIVVRKTDDAD